MTVPPAALIVSAPECVPSPWKVMMPTAANGRAAALTDAPPCGPPGKPAPLHVYRYGPLRVALLHAARGGAAGVVPVLRAWNLVQEVRKRAAGSGVVARLPGSARRCSP